MVFRSVREQNLLKSSWQVDFSYESLLLSTAIYIIYSQYITFFWDIITGLSAAVIPDNVPPLLLLAFVMHLSSVVPFLLSFYAQVVQ